MWHIVPTAAQCQIFGKGIFPQFFAQNFVLPKQLCVKILYEIFIFWLICNNFMLYGRITAIANDKIGRYTPSTCVYIHSAYK